MAELTIISETGMFHSACRCTWNGVIEWYGFKPARHRTPVGAGMVDRSDRSAYINHSITFPINDTVLRVAVSRVAAQYAGKEYVLGVCDCVSFSAEVARQCALRAPLVNMTPYGLIQALGWWNKCTAKT